MYVHIINHNYKLTRDEKKGMPSMSLSLLDQAVRRVRNIIEHHHVGSQSQSVDPGACTCVPPVHRRHIRRPPTAIEVHDWLMESWKYSNSDPM